MDSFLTETRCLFARTPDRLAKAAVVEVARDSVARAEGSLPVVSAARDSVAKAKAALVAEARVASRVVAAARVASRVAAAAVTRQGDQHLSRGTSSRLMGMKVWKY
jgi:hypothetical protein